MEYLLEQGVKTQLLEHFWLTLFLLIPIVLIARAVVAGTRYSPILIIVIFGLTMGFVMVQSGVATPGLPEFPLLELISKVTIIALIASFFVGGQELRRLFAGHDAKNDDMVVPSNEEIVLGTKRTQLAFLIRSFFILLGIEGLSRLVLGTSPADQLGGHYALVAYIGLVGSVILIDHKATIESKHLYIRKGIAEIIGILLILVVSARLAQAIRPVIALPQIFFAMILSASLGMIASKWRFGPTLRSLLFAGIPVVLAASFMIGGSRIGEAFRLTGMTAVMSYGFFGQMFWMFGGMTILILFGLANHVRNLAPGMAGSLSHSGLTGACTAGDLGPQAQARAPIMINVPFFGHVFVFSILAASYQMGNLLTGWALLVLVSGLAITVLALRTLRQAEGKDANEVKGLMQFSFGWQLTAVFGGLLLLQLGGIPLSHAVMANSSALSHFGLFAAIQGGMFGEQVSLLIPFIFAMPFLVHPLVFGIFGKAMDNEGRMPAKVVFTLAAVGVIGVVYALFA